MGRFDCMLAKHALGRNTAMSGDHGRITWTRREHCGAGRKIDADRVKPFQGNHPNHGWRRMARYHGKSCYISRSSPDADHNDELIETMPDTLSAESPTQF